MKTKSIFLYLIPALMISLTVSCNNESAEESLSTDVVHNPASASANVDPEKAPVFEFETMRHDFGKIIDGEKVSYNFKFKNIGKSDLLISAVNAGCGCTAPDWPKSPIPAGKSGHVTVVFDSKGRVGNVDKSVTVLANTIPNSLVLTFSGVVVKE